jgi:hypothetical protein
MNPSTRDGRGRAALYVVSTMMAALGSLPGCAASTHSQDLLVPPSGVQLVALEESHDFGTVENGPVVTHTFKLKNFGPDTIDIQSVIGACGCTAVLASTPQLAPGQEGGVQVALDTYKLSGEQAKTVTVRSNDPVRPELSLSLHGFVATDVHAAPARVYLGRLPVGAVVSQHVDVKLARPDVQVTGVSSESGRLAVETAPLDPPQNGVRVRVTLLPTSTTGTFDDRIVVSTNSARQPQLTIPVLGTIESQEVYARHRGDDTGSR